MKNAKTKTRYKVNKVFKKGYHVLFYFLWPVKKAVKKGYDPIRAMKRPKMGGGGGGGR
jgi:hypothetical protein